MKHLKVTNDLFVHYNNFIVDKGSNIYLTREVTNENDELKEIVVFNKELEEINTFSYKAVYDYLKTTRNQDRFTRFYVTHDNLFVIGTKHNRVFLLNQNGEVLNSYYEKDDSLISEFNGKFEAQKNHFAEGFFDTKDNKVLILTYGYGYGGINKRGRFIIGISKDKNPSFLENEPFATEYINDVWGNSDETPPIYPKNMDTSNLKHPNIWHEISDFKIYEQSIFPLLIKNQEEYYKTLDSHKLGNSTRKYKFVLDFLELIS